MKCTDDFDNSSASTIIIVNNVTEGGVSHSYPAKNANGYIFQFATSESGIITSYATNSGNVNTGMYYVSYNDGDDYCSLIKRTNQGVIFH